MMKKCLQVLLAGALIAGTLVLPAGAQQDTSPILESAEHRSGLGHELGNFEITDRPLTVVVGTEPAVNDNTYGYLNVRYFKWNAKKNKWVPRKKSGEYPKGWSNGYWNEDTQRFEAAFVKAPAKGKCKLVAKYGEDLHDSTITKDKKVFKCGQGFAVE